jgi:hypothetical protein
MLPGLNKDFVSRCIHPKDLQNRDLLAVSCDAAGLVRRAETILRYGFVGIDVDQITIRGNTAHCIRSTPHAVVLRSLSQLLRSATGIKSSDRDTIIQRLHTVLQEGVQHRVYKFDIKTFFESLDRGHLFAMLAQKPEVPRTAITVLKNYFDELSTKGIAGLPRGIQLSATLSEFVLQNFDRELSQLPEVYFHARYVDDIIIITGSREDPAHFSKAIRTLLPGGLTFNHQKTKVIDIPNPIKGQQITTVGQFDYLGYSFTIHNATRNADRRFDRRVEITLAHKKLRRMKSRICLAVCQFMRDKDDDLLERRLQLLTGNCNIRDFATRRRRSIGLYCNYRRLNSHSALKELDDFMRSLFVGSRSRIARRLSAITSPARCGGRPKLEVRFSFSTAVRIESNTRERLSICSCKTRRFVTPPRSLPTTGTTASTSSSILRNSSLLKRHSPLCG